MQARVDAVRDEVEKTLAEFDVKAMRPLQARGTPRCALRRRGRAPRLAAHRAHVWLAHAARTRCPMA